METALRMRPVARALALIVLVLTIAFLLFAAVPFFANGIHLRSYSDIAGSFVDVKGYPPFTWLGGPAQGIAMLSAGYVQPLTIVLTPLLIVALGFSWRALLARERTAWIGVVVVNLVTVLALWQITSLITLWLVD